MTRMRISVAVVAFLAGTLVACSGGSGTGARTLPASASDTATTVASPATGRAAKPNIILIVTDDQRADEWQYMPNVQKYLAAEGASLPNFIISDPLCCPSRVSILTGQYAHNHGVTSNIGGFKESRTRKLDVTTLATVLKGAGYTTGLFGKYLNGYAPGNMYIPPGWDRWAATSWDDPPQSYRAFSVNDQGEVHTYNPADGKFQPLEVAGLAQDWLRDVLSRPEPVFAAVMQHAPHSPYSSEPKYSEMFKDITFNRTDAFDEEDVQDKPAHIRALPRLTNFDDNSIDVVFRSQLRALQTVDEMVGRIIALLTTIGELDNTYVFITNDNGVMLGEHRIQRGKQVAYEESVRVGGYVRGPGVPAGGSYPELMANIDLLPTFAEIAGVAIPSFVDGRSFLSIVTGRAAAFRRAIAIESYPDDLALGDEENDGPPLKKWSGFRTNELKYIEYETGERELYDLVADPYETENLAGTRDTSAYSAYLAKLKVCKTDDCRRLEDEGPP